MQLYVLDKCPIKSAQLIPAKLRGNNYAQKMLIELCQCLSNLMGNKYVDEKFYKYKAVPPEFVAFIFQNRAWVGCYANALLCNCFKLYDNFIDTETYKNCSYIISSYYNICGGCYFNPNNAWFIPTKEYGKRQYLPIEDCIAEYKKYLQWKMKEV